MFKTALKTFLALLLTAFKKIFLKLNENNFEIEYNFKNLPRPIEVNQEAI
jgi:hypothetical protein